jgi:hypothetical protein
MTQTQKQAFRRRFHSLFNQVCNHFEKEPTTSYRHQVSRWILGYEKSSSLWTGKEYSLVVDQLKEWIKGDVEPHPLAKQERERRSHDERHKQLVHVITKLAPDAYIQAVANDRHSQRPWRNLSAFEPTRLRYTLESRAAAKRRQGKTLHQ